MLFLAIIGFASVSITPSFPLPSALCCSFSQLPHLSGVGAEPRDKAEQSIKERRRIGFATVSARYS